MYDLPYHKEQNQQIIKEFINKHPFAFLTGCDADNKPVATQIPILLREKEGKQFLWGHFMKNTDHHKAFIHNDQALVVFTGSHSYVSGTWYSNPYIASTWNYMSVHVQGRIRFLEDDALEEILRFTTLHFENQNHDSPTVFDNLLQNFRQNVMQFIVGFEMEILELKTVFKLSQDRDEESYHNIIRELRKKDENGRVIAAEMEKRTKDLYS